MFLKVRLEPSLTMNSPLGPQLLPHTGHIGVCHHGRIQSIDAFPGKPGCMTGLPLVGHEYPVNKYV